MKNEENRIKKLIVRLCPEGVDFKELGEVADYVRGVTYGKGDEVQSSDGWKILRSNNISLSTHALNFDDVKVITKTARVRDNQRLKSGDILISAASGSKSHVGKVAYIKDDIDYYFGGFMAVIRTGELVNSQFLFHLLVGNQFSRYLENNLASTTINNLNAQIMNAFKIPLPPIAIQKEIVKILNKFTELESELESELEARKKQYEHYRLELLTFGKDVKYLDLGKLVLIKHGKDWKALESGAVPVYGTGGVMGYVDRFSYDKPTVLIPRKGSLNNIYYLEEPFWNVDTIYYTEIDTSVLVPKFFYYYIKTIDLSKLDTGSGRPSLTQAILSKIQVPVPSLAEQWRIVTILDKFDALVNDISIGLPAEIEARRRQYEYYREKLLTFKEYAKD